jgi:hypothetical protein
MGISAQLTAGRTRAGIALPAATLALALVAIIIAASFRMGMSGSKSVAGRDSATRALMLAEEGAAHAVTVIREQLAGKTSTQLLIGPDNSAGGTADNGLLVWTELTSGLQIPAGGRATAGGRYTARIIDDPAETDGLPFADRNERVLVECIGTTTDGASATVTLVVRSAPTPGVAIDGPLTVSGIVKINGACGSAHANGDVTIVGTLGISGQLSATGTVTGVLTNEAGIPTLPKTGVPSLDIPDLDPMANCASRDFQLYSSAGQGYLYQKSTNTTFNITSTEKFGWIMSSSSPVMFRLSAGSAIDGSVCANGSVAVNGSLGSAADPHSMSLYAAGSIQMSGNPFIVASPGDTVAVMAGGDLKITGSPDIGTRNFEGLVYGESQCQISGDPRINGQFVCKNKPDPVGAADIVSATMINGNPEITYNCNGKAAGRRRVALWTQPVS